MHAHLPHLEEPGPGAKGSGHRRRSDPARLQERRQADPPELTPRPRLLPASLEALPLRELQDQVQRGFVVPRVVLQQHRRLIGELIRLNEVLSPDLHRIDPQLAGGHVHQALDHERGFRSPRATDRVDRHRVGEDRLHFTVDGRRTVTSGEERTVQDRRHRRTERGEVGAEVGKAPYPKTQEVPFTVESELGVGHVVPTMAVGHERLGALGGPLHGPPDLGRRPGHDGLFRVVEDLGAEAAPHVGRHHSQLVLRDLQHVRAHEEPDHVRVLARRVERVVAARRVVIADGHTRLDGIRDETVLHDVDRHHVLRTLERRVGGRLVADLPVEAHVAWCLFPHLWRIVGHGLIQERHCRKALVVHLDERSRLLGRCLGLGYDDGDDVPHVPHPVHHDRRMGRLGHG